MMSFSPSSARESWEQRRFPAVTIVPYVLLAILAAFTVVLKHGEPGSLLIDLALCALAAAWMLWMITLHPAWRARPPVMAVFLAGLIVIMMVLVVRDSWFGFFTAAGYLYAFRVLPWPWELFGIAGRRGRGGHRAGVRRAEDDRTRRDHLSGRDRRERAADVRPGLGRLERRPAQHADANRRSPRSARPTGGLRRRWPRTPACTGNCVTQAREAGVLDERARMAREIHDTLAQGLTGIITQLQAAEQAGDDPAEWRRHLDAATGLARESLSEARRSVDALRPEPLATARLGEALAGVAERWSALHGVAACGHDDRHGPADVAGGRARAAAHGTGGARQRRPARAGDPGRPDAVVHGARGGAGRPRRRRRLRSDSSAAASRRFAGGGFGLIAMRQRIEGLCGTLQVESEPGVGTAISACVPAAVSA